MKSDNSFEQNILKNSTHTGNSDNWNDFKNYVKKGGKIYVWNGSSGKTKKWTVVAKSEQGWPILESEDGERKESIGQNWPIGFVHYSNV